MRPRGTKVELERRRRTAISLLRRYGVREVARRVGASPGAVERWKTAYAAGGRVALRAKPDRGARPKLTARQQARLTRLVRQGARAHGYGTELWTLARVAAVIEHEWGVSYSLAGVWVLLRRLGWSCQKPARQARERDAQAIQRWRTKTWPKLRKRRRGGGAHARLPG